MTKYFIITIFGIKNIRPFHYSLIDGYYKTIIWNLNSFNYCQKNMIA